MPPAPQPPSADKLLQRVQWDDLDVACLRRLVETARDEDLAGLGLRRRPARTGDLSTASVSDSPRQCTAALVAREPLVVCGLGLVPIVLSVYGGRATAQFSVRDGATVLPGRTLATLHGDPRVLLAAERILLNFLQRLSGIATHTRRHVASLGPGRTRLLDTRKTTPGYRMIEKYAVACGGGWNHRLGLFDRVMLKDNHLALLGFAGKNVRNDASPAAAAAGRLAAAVAAARRTAPGSPVEIEVDRLDQIPAALSAGADVILLDNFTVPRLRKAVALIGGRAFTEASGGITLRTLGRLRGIGLDFVSTGALVHHSVWSDIGLDWRP
jgi:nicotinate-nucleotide pyrophosphorylase (carboxylating)